MKKKECIAMILAGGQGSRLGILTKNQAKPAVPFGGKYRIIDFTLSNCTNSNIDTIGVLTQYNPFVLHSTIGIGSPWDLDRKNGGISILPPSVKEMGGEWYKGTANAIYQNLDFIRQFDPEYVLILSGDHIYKMDYSLMLDFHKQKGADITIAVIEVPWEEASRFGVMTTDNDGRIVKFQEKPEKPESNLASMGIYIFGFEMLEKYLVRDEEDPNSSNDFGKNVIPSMLNSGAKPYAYAFDGYWKDVGTVSSLWEANMDLLKEKPRLSLHDNSWRIYTTSLDFPPQYTAPNASVKGSLLNDGCVVHGEIEQSILFPGVEVGPGSVVKNSIIMPNTKIGSNCKINKAIIGEDAVVEDNALVGWEKGEADITVISEKSIVKGGGAA